MSAQLPLWRLTLEQQLLCTAISDREMPERTQAARQLLDAIGEEAAFALAEANEVTSQLAHAVMAIPNRVADSRWEAAHERNARKLQAFLDELDAVAAYLADEHIPLVALKNGGIARGIYPCVGCCPMGDLDVLVKKSDFERAHRLLQALGYRLKFRSELEEDDFEKACASGSAEYYKTLAEGTELWFELLWRPVDGRWIRAEQEPDAGELIARSVSIPGTKVRLLSPEDNLLQVCLHTAKHTYVRAPGFRLHTDVDRIVRRQTVDWARFQQKVCELQVKTAVYFSLAIPAAIFETPIPAEVLAHLRPARWKETLLARWLNRVGLFGPHEKKFSKPGYILFNALLYDDLRGLLRSIFPETDWMKERYGFQSDWLLPTYYLRRLFALAFRRVST